MNRGFINEFTMWGPHKEVINSVLGAYAAHFNGGEVEGLKFNARKILEHTKKIYGPAAMVDYFNGLARELQGK